MDAVEIEQLYSPASDGKRNKTIHVYNTTSKYKLQRSICYILKQSDMHASHIVNVNNFNFEAAIYANKVV